MYYLPPGGSAGRPFQPVLSSLALHPPLPNFPSTFGPIVKWLHTTMTSSSSRRQQSAQWNQAIPNLRESYIKTQRGKMTKGLRVIHEIGSTIGYNGWQHNEAQNLLVTPSQQRNHKNSQTSTPSGPAWAPRLPWKMPKIALFKIYGPYATVMSYYIREAWIPLDKPSGKSSTAFA